MASPIPPEGQQPQIIPDTKWEKMFEILLPALMGCLGFWQSLKVFFIHLAKWNFEGTTPDYAALTALLLFVLLGYVIHRSHLKEEMWVRHQERLHEAQVDSLKKQITDLQTETTKLNTSLAQMEENLPKNVQQGIKEELANGALGKPYIELFRKGRQYFETSFALLHKLNLWQEKAVIQDKAKVAKKIRQLFNSLDELTKQIACDFFNVNKAEIGINYMFFYTLREAPLLEKRLSEKSKCLGYRQQKDKLKGLLYLEPTLGHSVGKKEITNDLCIPIYQLEARVYNEGLADSKIAIPGAPYAFYWRSSAINNTLDVDNYRKLNEYTRNEVISYFNNYAKNTTHIISFGIPVSGLGEGNEKDCIAVLNIETSSKSSFKHFKGQVAAFYGIIFPVLKLYSPYLKQYKDFIAISSLQKS